MSSMQISLKVYFYGIYFTSYIITQLHIIVKLFLNPTQTALKNTKMQYFCTKLQLYLLFDDVIIKMYKYTQIFSRKETNMRKVFALILALATVLSLVSCAVVTDNRILSDSDVQTLTETTEPITVIAADAAYIRSGDGNKDTVYKDTPYYFIKNDGATTTRHVLVKYDISSLTIPTSGSINLVVTFFSVSPIHPSLTETEIKLRAYKETSDWNSSTVTFASIPELSETNFVGEADLIKNDVYINITDCVKQAAANGEKTVSLRLVPSIRTQAEMRIYTLSSDFPPRMVIQAAEEREFYQTKILADETANTALWDYAKQTYNEWKVRYDEIVSKGDYETDTIQIDKSQYTFTTDAILQNEGNKAFTNDTRLATTLVGFTPNSEEIEYDKYGGIISDTRLKPTGHFYTQKIGNRWFVIDPLGYPCYVTGINHTYYAYDESEYQTRAMSEKWGSEEKWAISTTRWLKSELGFNVALGTDATILGIEQGTATTVYVPGVGRYASSIGLNSSTGGTTDFLYNGTMPVFDPAFATYINNIMPEAIEMYKDNDKILGFISDNELPTADSMLTDYLTLDPTIEANHYSYVCAWTWITEFTGKKGEEINVAKIDELSTEVGVDLRTLFKGFVYDKYFSVMQPAIKAVCPNHLYLGVRLLTGFQWGEWVGRFNGYWCDIMCINYYGVWEISPEQIDNFQKWTGKPFMITEFYAKGADAIGADGKPFTNTDGAGWTCNTQTERGYFYQNFTLRLLEAKNCIGWLYFQYIDNDPTDENVERGQKNSNKGIVNSDHDREIYKDYHSQIALINNNKYSLIEYFDGSDIFE